MRASRAMAGAEIWSWVPRSVARIHRHTASFLDKPVNMPAAKSTNRPRESNGKISLIFFLGRVREFDKTAQYEGLAVTNGHPSRSKIF